MILFKKLTYSNFLSSGDNPIVIELDKANTTLVVGTNGAGKSTLIDALSFALFGKPFRGVNKPQLVNSINSRSCYTRVDFSVGTIEYSIIRGMKPNIFEIWEGGVLITQNSNIRDYQKHLEVNILKLNHRTFHQVVVLGSANYTPFMKLPAAARRSVIEDILDIGVFSRMNLIVREDIAKQKERLKELDNQLVLNKAATRLHRDLIKSVEDMQEERSASDLARISELNKQIGEADYKLVHVLNEAACVEEEKRLRSHIRSITTKCSELKEFVGAFNSQAKTLAKETMFFEKNQNCPSCAQEITDDLRHEKIHFAKNKANELLNAKTMAESNIRSYEARLEELSTAITTVIQKLSDIKSTREAAFRYVSEIRKIEDEIAKRKQSKDKVDDARRKLVSLLEEHSDISDEKSEVNEAMLYSVAIAEMLKDTGIKTKVINNYLPHMNKIINHYLELFDFYVSFNIDETFTEVIRSRYRDEFTYDSFSEGEKQKIDLSILFAWRGIARMKNSVTTNILIMDETFDSSLDVDSTEALTRIIQDIGNDARIFIISHKGEQLEGKFDRKLSFKKENNFSKMEEA